MQAEKGRAKLDSEKIPPIVLVRKSTRARLLRRLRIPIPFPRSSCVVMPAYVRHNSRHIPR